MTHSDSEFDLRWEFYEWFDGRAEHAKLISMPTKQRDDIIDAYLTGKQVIIINTPKRTAICIPK
jgi:hypothetical protein